MCCRNRQQPYNKPSRIGSFPVRIGEVRDSRLRVEQIDELLELDSWLDIDFKNLKVEAIRQDLCLIVTKTSGWP